MLLPNVIACNIVKIPAVKSNLTCVKYQDTLRAATMSEEYTGHVDQRVSINGKK